MWTFWQEFVLVKQIQLSSPWSKWWFGLVFLFVVFLYCVCCKCFLAPGPSRSSNQTPIVTPLIFAYAIWIVSLNGWSHMQMCGDGAVDSLGVCISGSRSTHCPGTLTALMLSCFFPGVLQCFTSLTEGSSVVCLCFYITVFYDEAPRFYFTSDPRTLTTFRLTCSGFIRLIKLD